VPLDTRRAAGCPVRRRWAGGMGADGLRKVGKMCALSRRPAARGSAGAGPAEVWGSLSGRQTRVLPLGAAVRWAVYRMVTCLRSRLRTFPLADSKNIFVVLAPGAGGGLRVRENVLNEEHQACRTKKPIDEGFRTRGHSCPVRCRTNQLVSVAVRVGFEIICCKSHEICVFSKMKTERICRHVWREASRWSSFLMMAIRT